MSLFSERRGSASLDRHVGARLRLRRRVRGLSEAELGEAVELSALQIQKFENGVSRVSATKLFEMAGALKTPIAYFFEGGPALTSEGEGEAADKADARAAVMEFLSSPEGLGFVAAFARIDSERLRGGCAMLLRLLADGAAPGADGETVEPY